MLIKLSYLAFISVLYRILDCILIYTCMGAVRAFGVSFAVINIAQCEPIQRVWQYDPPGTCIDIRASMPQAMPSV